MAFFLHYELYVIEVPLSLIRRRRSRRRRSRRRRSRRRRSERGFVKNPNRGCNRRCNRGCRHILRFETPFATPLLSVIGKGAPSLVSSVC
jgi:hypothetical protein